MITALMLLRFLMIITALMLYISSDSSIDSWISSHLIQYIYKYILFIRQCYKQRS